MKIFLKRIVEDKIVSHREQPKLPHLTEVRPVHVGPVRKRGDLVHLLPEAQGQLAGHRAREGQAEGLAGGDVDLRVEGVALGHGDGEALGVDAGLGVAVFAL